MKRNHIRFIDLFAGMGGIRLGFEQACEQQGLQPTCVLTSEIKEHALQAYRDNFPAEPIWGDVSLLNLDKLPDFDVLLAGFPCQPFSHAGKRQGFADTRGTLFFEIEKILAHKKPFGFLLENVEGLVGHDGGRTLRIILEKLTELGYKTTWEVLNAKDFGVPQDRKRIFIVGSKTHPVSLQSFPKKTAQLASVLEKGLPVLDTAFTKMLLAHYAPHELLGKAIKDKRGGKDNIHSWDIELKGAVSAQQRSLLEQLLRERRKKHWAVQKGIRWMDGMPLTLDEIATFFLPNQSKSHLKALLDDLVAKGYVRFEHPKDLVTPPGKTRPVRQYKTDVPKGYNIVVGNLSFEIRKILDENGICPTLVAADMGKLAVVDGQGIRHLSIREGLRLSGFPDSYQLNMPATQAYDLLGNTVVVDVVRAIAERLLSVYQHDKPINIKSQRPIQEGLFQTGSV